MRRRRARLLWAGAALGLVLALAIGISAALEAHLSSPPPTLLLVDRRGEYLGEISEGPDAPLGFWRADPIPERVAAAMIAIEDRNFASHHGVDFGAVGRAVWQNLRSGHRVSGASTIAMQVARMQHPGPRTVRRKIVEAATAMMLTARYGRDAVLAHYLQIAPYGNHLHGIEYAARRYLNKPAADLSWAEIAFLAAIPQSPARMNPYTARGRLRAIARGSRILDLLAERGVLGQAELDLAHRQLAAIGIPRAPARPTAALHFAMRAAEALKAHPPADPLVVTSLDLALQEEAAETTERLVSRWANRGAENAAAIVVDRETHEVLAYVGSADYFDAAHAGAIDFANTPRASGSTLKPFVYALALDRGVITPSTILDDLHRASRATENADREFLGPLLPRVALGNSRNIPAVNLLLELGPYHAYELFAELGLHDRRLPYDHYGSGIAIGLLPVTLSDLVRGYTALAGDGRVRELHWVHGESAGLGRRVFSEDSARQLSLFLSDPLARLPSFPRMGATEYPFPVALKTGTSENYRDAWTVAYSRRYLVGAWVGRADAQPMTLLGGAGSAARLVRELMFQLHRAELRGMADLSFPPPHDHVPHKVCERTGLLATPACEHTFIEWFRKGEEPTEYCGAHVAIEVDTRTGVLAGAGVPRENVELRTFTALAPRYASWAAAHGLVAPPLPARAIAVSGVQLTDAAPLRVPEISEPEDGARLVRDPETPAELSTLALGAVVDPRVKQIVWYVDGRPFRTVSSPFAARWPLVPGRHTFQARAAFAEQGSSVVTVFVE